MTRTVPREGDVWRDRDPRGGPTFRIVKVGPVLVDVENVDGAKRPRTIKVARFASDYELIIRHGWDPFR